VTDFTVPAAPSVPYSDWIHRVGGLLIDQAPIVALIIIGAVLHSIPLLLLFYLVALVVQGYNRWYLGGQGQSWGKMALNMRLISEDTGQPIGTLMAFVRDVCHIVDSIICYIGYLFPLWDPKRQTLADKIIRTIVVPA
jgi:uncharacterized RDD family membrane protein YckC